MDASLRDLAAQHHFYVGTAVNTGAFCKGQEPYCEILKREFNILVGENMMKFGELSPSPNSYDWTASDALVDFAEANTMKLRGHTLVWHHQLPRWITTRTWTSQQAQELLEHHIKTVVGRYRGRIWAWDVVNEAIADTGDDRTDSFWYKHLGRDYIALAFRYAHEADRDAILYYNDYEAEALGPKSDAVYALLRSLKQSLVPIHGVGWQMHIAEGWHVTNAHRENAQRLHALGLELAMTELDLRLRLPASVAQLEAQAASYHEVTSFALETCVALLTWGLTDRYSWIPGFRPGYGAPLLFDADYHPKPAYQAMWQALGGNAQHK